MVFWNEYGRLSKRKLCLQCLEFRLFLGLRDHNQFILAEATTEGEYQFKDQEHRSANRKGDPGAVKQGTREREIDVAISYGAVLERAGMLSVALGTERIVPLCSPDLIKDNLPIHQILSSLVLIDSQLSSVTWPKWFALNNLVLPERPRPSFDRAALAISAAVDGTGVAMESIRLAEREISRGELVELGAGIFESLALETHFVSCRIDERQLKKVRLFREWLFKAAGVIAN